MDTVRKARRGAAAALAIASAALTAGCTTITSIEQYRRTLLFGQMAMTAQMIRALGGGATQFSINAGDPVVYVGGVDIGLFIGDDQEWDNWRLEGPSFVWYFRGTPHVHVWVNVADDSSVETNAKG